MDTLKLADDIERAGFTHQQAHGLARALADSTLEELATKHDVAGLGAVLRTEIAELRAELKTEIAELRTELKTEVAELRTELKTETANLRTEFKTKSRICAPRRTRALPSCTARLVKSGGRWRRS